jgi:poly-gamma-glutamate capsule biosynthesis protein CapA/YwtB (metallophosphatase superfamily)
MQGIKLSLAVVGDCQITTRHSPCMDPRFLELVEILRGADATYANMEQCIHNLGPDCYPARVSGGTYTFSPPFVADEIKWMGVDLVSLATNHGLDWMYGGLKETIANLDRVNIPHAGTGMNLAEARAPCFFDSESGRVALISVDTSKPEAEASDARRDAPGRPGNNTVKVSQTVTLDAELFKAFKLVANQLRSLGFVKQREDSTPLPSDVKEIDLGIERRGWPVKFVLGDNSGSHYTIDESDLNDVVQIISDANRQADWTFISQHHHITDALDRDVPSKAVEAFARRCLNEGADAYFGTGPHRIQGIEIYEGKPIFYSLPDFIQQRDMVKVAPQVFYENFGLGFTNTPMDSMDARGMKVTSPPRGSGIVVCKFEKHAVKEIKIYPVDPQADLPRWQMGRPRRADESLGRKIVEHWAKLSEAYGTTIEYENGVGTVKIKD